MTEINNLRREVAKLLADAPISSPRRGGGSGGGSKRGTPTFRNAMYAPRESSQRRDDAVFSNMSRSPRFSTGSPRRRRAPKASGAQQQHTTTKFRGVVWDAARNAWRAEVGVRDAVSGVVERRVIGHYGTDADAARAFDQVVSQMRDPSLVARLNFPAPALPTDSELARMQRQVGQLTTSSTLAARPRGSEVAAAAAAADPLASLTLKQRDQRLRTLAREMRMSSPAPSPRRTLRDGNSGQSSPRRGGGGVLINAPGSTMCSRIGVRGRTNPEQPGGGRGGQAPTFDVLRMGRAGGGSDAGGELSTTAKLRAIFKRYARYGSSVAQSSIGLQGWLKLVQHAGVVFADAGASTERAAKIFVRSTESAKRAATEGGAALNFSGFLRALTLLANAAEPPSSTPSAALGPHRALERLLSGYVLLNLWPLPSLQGGEGGVPPGGASGDATARSPARGSRSLMSDSSETFFAEHRQSLKEIFTRYAIAEQVQQQSGTWARTRQQDLRLTFGGLARWASDSGVVPDMMTRLEMRQAYDFVLSATAVSEGLPYDKWLEFLCLIAHRVAGGPEGGGDAGIGEAHELGMLFVRMRRQANVTFVNPVEKRIVKRVETQIRDEQQSRRSGAAGKEQLIDAYVQQLDNMQLY